jgi:hypothetical protein
MLKREGKSLFSFFGNLNFWLEHKKINVYPTKLKIVKHSEFGNTGRKEKE